MHVIADYRGEWKFLMQQFKYHHQPELSRLLARLFYQRIALNSLPEILLPVPMHPWRQWRRGYNQAQEIARPITQQLNIPCNNRLLARTRATKVQAGLSRELRQTNLNNAFIIKPHSYRHVAVLDDVVTTGVTVTTLVRLLKASGCQRVDVWAICRTQLRGE